jgi:hypothetical protein
MNFRKRLSPFVPQYFFLLLLLLKNVRIKMYQTILLPFVLYGCGTWSLVLRWEHRLRVCWGRYLGLEGMKLQEVAGRRAQWFVFLAQHYLGDQVTEGVMGRTCGTLGKKKNVCRLLAGKPEGKRPLGRQWLRLEAALIFFTNAILICWRHSQIFELFRTFNGFITYLYVVSLSCMWLVCPVCG